MEKNTNRIDDWCNALEDNKWSDTSSKWIIDSFVDDKSRMEWVYFLKHKSQAFETFNMNFKIIVRIMVFDKISRYI